MGNKWNELLENARGILSEVSEAEEFIAFDDGTYPPLDFDATTTKYLRTLFRILDLETPEGELADKVRALAAWFIHWADIKSVED